MEKVCPDHETLPILKNNVDKSFVKSKGTS